MSKEIAAWCLVCDEGTIRATYSTYEAARKYLGDRTDRRIVKLTGEIPEPKKIKRIATYAYRYGNGAVIVSSALVTEDQAREFCNELTLVKWPYGEIIEIE
jgi:hypothetical protein